MTVEGRLIEELKDKLLNLGPMLPGYLSRQWNVCGSSGCKCKNPDKPIKHGPYYQLSYTLNGKSSTVFVKKTVLRDVSARIKRHKQFRDLCNRLVATYIAEFRKHGKEAK